jgi:hypothetical protein
MSNIRKGEWGRGKKGETDQRPDNLYEGNAAPASK